MPDGLGSSHHRLHIAANKRRAKRWGSSGRERAPGDSQGQIGFNFGDNVLGDMWEWNGNDWSPLAASGPSARTFTKMVYDQRRRKLVLFGGHDGAAFLNDTWEFGAVRADWNNIGRLDSQDLFDFLADFFEDAGDFNADGATSSQDFFDFLAEFFGEC